MVKDNEPELLNKLKQPEKLTSEHILSEFNSGHESLNHWLNYKARHNDLADASRTYVVCENKHVIAYCCLSTGAINRNDVTGRLRRNMPNPIPVMILRCLAVDLSWQRHGIGAALLRDALLRTIQVSEIAGVKALLVHAISDQAVEFYKKWGFYSSPINSKTLFLSIHQAKSFITLKSERFK